MSQLIKVAWTDQFPVGARKLCTVEDRQIAMFNLSGTLSAEESTYRLTAIFSRLPFGQQRIIAMQQMIRILQCTTMI